MTQKNPVPLQTRAWHTLIVSTQDFFSINQNFQIDQHEPEASREGAAA